jgi:hypothetical protein
MSEWDVTYKGSADNAGAGFVKHLYAKQLLHGILVVGCWVTVQ